MKLLNNICKCNNVGEHRNVKCLSISDDDDNDNDDYDEEEEIEG